jgi:hypothetical protein
MTKLIEQEISDVEPTPATSEPKGPCPVRTSETFEEALRKRAQQTRWEPLWVRLSERMCE